MLMSVQSSCRWRPSVPMTHSDEELLAALPCALAGRQAYLYSRLDMIETHGCSSVYEYLSFL